MTSLLMVGCSSFVSVEQKFTDGSPYKYSAKKKSKFHTVRKGETLYSIAWTYGWDFRSLARANKIKSPYTIFKGQKIDVSNPRMIASAPLTSSGPASNGVSARASTAVISSWPAPRSTASRKARVLADGTWATINSCFIGNQLRLTEPPGRRYETLERPIPVSVRICIKCSRQTVWRVPS